MLLGKQTVAERNHRDSNRKHVHKDLKEMTTEEVIYSQEKAGRSSRQRFAKAERL